MLEFLVKVQTLWENDSTLNGLLDVKHFFTGLEFRSDPPFAWIELRDNNPQYANKDHVLHVLDGRIYVVHETHLIGSNIKDAIVSLFSRASFNLANGRVIAMAARSVSERQDRNKIYRFTIKISAIVQPD